MASDVPESSGTESSTPENAAPDHTPSENSGSDPGSDSGSGSDAGLRRFRAELHDAVSLRATLLVLGVLGLQLGFVLSYIGAFHAPTPHRIPVAVVAQGSVAQQVVSQLDALSGDPVRARVAATEQEARALILNRTVDAAILVDAGTSTDTLLVATAGGPAVASVAEQIAQRVESTEHRQVTVTDIRPPAAGDGRGLSSFYLVLGLFVG